MLEFSKKIKELRLGKGYSQTKLASKLGINKSIISAYENQERYPSVEVLIKLAKEFKVSVDWLVGLDKNCTLDISGLSNSQVLAIEKIIEEFNRANKK